jgi:hypothetical protein
MNKAIIDSNGFVNNIVIVPDNWTGAEDEWQPPAGQSAIDVGNGSPGYTWDGTQFIDPNQITEEEQTENHLAALRVERNDLLAKSDWTQSPDSPVTSEAKSEWSVYRQELRDLPENVEDPANPIWPVGEQRGMRRNN